MKLIVLFNGYVCVCAEVSDYLVAGLSDMASRVICTLQHEESVKSLENELQAAREELGECTRVRRNIRSKL